MNSSISPLTKYVLSRLLVCPPFQQFITNLPHGQYANFRASVKLELLKVGIDITDQTFRNWENGTYEPDQPQKREVINAVAVAMTGQPIY